MCKLYRIHLEYKGKLETEGKEGEKEKDDTTNTLILVTLVTPVIRTKTER